MGPAHNPARLAEWHEKFADWRRYIQAGRLKRGRRWKGYMARVCPTDPNVIELGYYYRATSWADGYKKLSIKNSTGFIVNFALTSEGFTWIEINKFDPADYYTKIQCPWIDELHVQTWKNNQVSAPLNSTLAAILPGMHYRKHGGPLFPGFDWRLSHKAEPNPICGSIRYDAATYTIVPVSRQPVRKENGIARKRINAGLLRANKHMAILCRLDNKFNIDLLKKTMSVLAHNPPSWQQTIKHMLEFDPTDQDDVAKLLCFCSAYSQSYYLAPCFDASNFNWGHIPFHPRHKERMRRALYKVAQVVKYE